MGNANTTRIFRAVASGALFMLLSPGVRAGNYAPEEADFWKPHLSADMAGPEMPTMFASDSTATVFEIYFSNLEPILLKLDPRKRVSDPPPPGELRPEPPAIWTYRQGEWSLAIGPAGAGKDSPVAIQLLKLVDEPAAFLIMGAGLILMIVVPRYHRRAVERRKAEGRSQKPEARSQESEVAPKNSRTAGGTRVRLIFRVG